MMMNNAMTASVKLETGVHPSVCRKKAGFVPLKRVRSQFVQKLAAMVYSTAKAVKDVMTAT
jgi:hypothetical protein